MLRLGRRRKEIQVSPVFSFLLGIIRQHGQRPSSTLLYLLRKSPVGTFALPDLLRRICLRVASSSARKMNVSAMISPVCLADQGSFRSKVSTAPVRGRGATYSAHRYVSFSVFTHFGFGYTRSDSTSAISHARSRAYSYSISMCGKTCPTTSSIIRFGFG